MRVFLTTDVKMGVAQIKQGEPTDYIALPSIDFEQLPQPDKGDLEKTIVRIITDEKERGNNIDVYSMYVLYSAKRFKGLKAKEMHVPEGSANNTPKSNTLITDIGEGVIIDPWAPLEVSREPTEDDIEFYHSNLKPLMKERNKKEMN
jgi:hypothetical protein